MDENEKPPVEAQTTEPAADHGAPDESTQGGKRGGLGRLIGWLILLAILAVAAWFGWRYWQERQSMPDNAVDGTATPAELASSQRTSRRIAEQVPAASGEQTAAPSVSSDQAVSNVDQPAVRAGGAREARLQLLESQVERLRGQLQSLRQQRSDDQRTEQVVRNQLLGLEDRVGEVEDATVKLARQRLSARDSMLIGDAEMLLQLGAQRYRLFGDAGAAAQAFALADNSLAAVDSPRFAAVRQAIASEREALVATQPESRAGWLDGLTKLRLDWQSLPLARTQEQQPASADQGAWQRTLDTLSGLVKVRHTSGEPGSLAMADAALARQLGALDLATAQAALLAGDPAASRAALARASATMAHAFDMTDATARALGGQLEALRQSIPAAAAGVELGAALHKLRDLRAVGAINRSIPDAPANAPAPRPVPAAAASVPRAPAPAAAGSAA